MYWDYWKFPRHPIAAKRFKRIGKILSFHIIITGYTQILINVFEPSIGFHVHVKPMLLNLINISYQILLHHLNRGMHVVICFSIIKYLNIKTLGGSWNFQTTTTPCIIGQYSCIDSFRSDNQEERNRILYSHSEYHTENEKIGS